MHKTTTFKKKDQIWYLSRPAVEQGPTPTPLLEQTRQRPPAGVLVHRGLAMHCPKWLPKRITNGLIASLGAKLCVHLFADHQIPPPSRHWHDINRKGALTSVQAAAALQFEEGCVKRPGARPLLLGRSKYDLQSRRSGEESFEKLCRYQLLLFSLNDFQAFVMMSSMTFWEAYQSEPFVQRWKPMSKDALQKRSKEIK